RKEDLPRRPPGDGKGVSDGFGVSSSERKREDAALRGADDDHLSPRAELNDRRPQSISRCDRPLGDLLFRESSGPVEPAIPLEREMKPSGPATSRWMLRQADAELCGSPLCP